MPMGGMVAARPVSTVRYNIIAGGSRIFGPAFARACGSKKRTGRQTAAITRSSRTFTSEAISSIAGFPAIVEIVVGSNAETTVAPPFS